MIRKWYEYFIWIWLREIRIINKSKDCIVIYLQIKHDRLFIGVSEYFYLRKLPFYHPIKLQFTAVVKFDIYATSFHKS